MMNERKVKKFFTGPMSDFPYAHYNSLTINFVSDSHATVMVEGVDNMYAFSYHTGDGEWYADYENSVLL